jgi:hypothetical protein
MLSLVKVPVKGPYSVPSVIVILIVTEPSLLSSKVISSMPVPGKPLGPLSPVPEEVDPNLVIVIFIK